MICSLICCIRSRRSKELKEASSEPVPHCQPSQRQPRLAEKWFAPSVDSWRLRGWRWLDEVWAFCLDSAGFFGSASKREEDKQVLASLMPGYPCFRGWAFSISRWPGGSPPVPGKCSSLFGKPHSSWANRRLLALKRAHQVDQFVVESLGLGHRLGQVPRAAFFLQGR